MKLRSIHRCIARHPARHFHGRPLHGSIALPRLKLTERNPLRSTLSNWESRFSRAGHAGWRLYRVYVNRRYEHGMPGIARGLVAAVCMLPSTSRCGASLPAIVRGIESTPAGAFPYRPWAQYGGAVFGCLAGFYLLRICWHGDRRTVAVAINVLVALLSWALGGSWRRIPGCTSGIRQTRGSSNRPVHLPPPLGRGALGA